MNSHDRGFSQFLETAASQFSDSSGAETETTSEGHQKKLSSEGHQKKPSSASSITSEGHGKKPPSASEALSSAKFLLDAAVSKLHKAESESGGDHQLDKAKIAAAATDVLGAARHYGKLDENKQGKYFQKAEDYLQKYGQERPTGTGNSAVHNSTSRPHSASESAPEDEENKYGKYFKTAEGYLQKYGQERPTGTGNSDVHNSTSRPHSSSESAPEDEENKYGRRLQITARRSFKTLFFVSTAGEQDPDWSNLRALGSWRNVLVWRAVDILFAGEPLILPFVSLTKIDALEDKGDAGILCCK